MKTQTRTKHRPRKRVSAYAPPLRKQSRAVCFSCRAVYDKGRWRWQTDDEQPYKEVLCPACKRIQDGDAAGRVLLYGAYYLQHRFEIDNLVQNVEQRERDQHPLERIMYSNVTAQATEFLTTGTHLARRISDAVQAAHKGTVTFRHPSSSQLRAYWQRE